MSSDGKHPQATGSTEFLRALAGGRATLVLGQRHSRGLLDDLRRDLAAIADQPEGGDLIRLLSAVRDEAAVEGLRRAFEVHPVAAELAAVAENPWSYVLTSAIDPQVHEAFQRGGLSGQQLRVLFAGHAGRLARPGTTTLTLLRLFGAVGERDLDYRPPTTPLELKRRMRLEIPLVLNDLPLLVGPGGHLAVAGVGSDDWLDAEILALACEELAAGSVHWFAGEEEPLSEEALRDLFGERLTYYERRFDEEITTGATDEARLMLSQAREQLLHPASRHVTVRRGTEAKTIAFSPAEWRRLSQVAVILDDAIVEAPSPSSALV